MTWSISEMKISLETPYKVRPPFNLILIFSSDADVNDDDCPWSQKPVYSSASFVNVVNVDAHHDL